MKLWVLFALFGTVLSATSTLSMSWNLPSSVTTKSSPRVLSASATLNDILYVFGGDNYGTKVNSVESYDTSEAATTSDFTVLTAVLPVASSGHTAVTSGSIIYLFGGDLTTVVKFDGTSFTSTSHTHTATRDWSAVTMSDGSIYLTGGRDASTGTAFTEVVKYVPGTGFTTLTSPCVLSVARYFHGSVAIGDKIYVIGGVVGCCCSSAVEVLDTSTSVCTQSSITVTSLTAKCSAGIGLAPNGLIIIAGGRLTTTGQAQKTVEWIDLTSSPAATTTSSMQTTRADHLMEVIFGRVFMVSGYTSSGAPTNTIEYTDEQAVASSCNTAIADTSYAGGVVKVATIDLPFLTQGFSFSGKLTMTSSTCSSCTVLSKSDCTLSTGGFQFGIRSDLWSLSLSGSGSFDFEGLSSVVQGTVYTFTLKLSSGVWTLTVNTVVSTLSKGPGEFETIMHEVRIGGRGSCDDSSSSYSGKLLGSITDIQLGPCDPVNLLEQYPGFGATNIPTSFVLYFITSDHPTTPNVDKQGVPYLTVSELDGTFVQQISGSTLTKSSPNAGEAKFVTATLTLTSATTYKITVPTGIVSNSTGVFTGLSNAYWIFSTAGLSTSSHTSSNDVYTVVNMDIGTFSSTSFFSSVSGVVYSCPVANMQLNELRAGSVVVRFQFVSMAPTTASTAETYYLLAFNDASLNTELASVSLGDAIAGTVFTRDGTVGEFQNILVKNSPDTIDDPTEITLTVTTSATADHGFKSGTTLQLVLPIEFLSGMPSSTSSITVELNSYPVASTGKTYTPTAMSSTTLTISTSSNPWGSDFTLGGQFTLTINGIAMPSSCQTLNGWVWILKSFLTDGTTLLDMLIKNPPQDSCAGKTAILFGDPHFQSFSGGSYDVNGRVGFFYNIISDVNFVWNSRFVSRNPRGHGTMHTYMGESAFLISGTHIYCDPEKWAMYVDGKQVETLDQRIYVGNGRYYVKKTSTIMYVRAPGFFVALKHVLKEHGKPLPHFDHVVKLTDESSGRRNPHGLLGQTALFKLPVKSKGHQGEGIIAGIFEDYEVRTLWSTAFKFSRYTYSAAE